jgi:hypothetical protein
MKRLAAITSIALLLYLALPAFQPKSPIAEQILKSIQIVDSFKPINNHPLFQSTYEVWFSIPIDHTNPQSKRFPLRDTSHIRSLHVNGWGN